MKQMVIVSSSGQNAASCSFEARVVLTEGKLPKFLRWLEIGWFWLFGKDQFPKAKKATGNSAQNALWRLADENEPVRTSNYSHVKRELPWDVPYETLQGIFYGKDILLRLSS
ncbi:hypothetical protein JNK13_09115 [bacterium]|nr:hypothetical protein [bacterium]